MLLTETIKKSTSAIKARRAALENKQSAEAYTKALAKLEQASNGIKSALECATAMKENGIVDTPLMDEETRTELLNCINDCGYGISERTLRLDTVNLLQSKGDLFAGQIKIIWKDAATKYSDGPKGYLSMIGSLSDDPKKAKDLVDRIGNTVGGDPSKKAINTLVSDVTDAKRITDSFALNDSIEAFLKKVSLHQATVLDLSPEIMSWLNEMKLMPKLKIRF